MMGDPSIREGYVQSTIAEGLKGAGTNTNGAMSGLWEWVLECKMEVLLWVQRLQLICSRCR